MRVTLKLATSLDGRIATASGESRWITGEAAREQVHRLRAANEAVLVGVGTAIADDPALTIRLPGYSRGQPLRVVMDSHGRLPPTAKLITTARDVATLVLTTQDCGALWPDSGVSCVRIEARDGRCDPGSALNAIKSYLHSDATVLIEGGGEVAASFLSAGLIDAIEWFRAPMVLGAEGRPAIGGLGLQKLGDAPRFRRVDVSTVGDDLWERYERS